MSFPFFNYLIKTASAEDVQYASEISEEMALSALKRNLNIPMRDAEYISQKILNGLAVIAVEKNTGEWAGFICLEVWENQRILANTGLIISEEHRERGLGKAIKLKAFELCRQNFPDAKIFSLTTHPKVMSTNQQLNYTEVDFSQVLADEDFLSPNTSHVDYIALMQDPILSKKYKAMMYYPESVFKWEPQTFDSLESRWLAQA